MRFSKLSLPFSKSSAFLIFVYFFTFAIAFRNVLSGSIPFWYDPARDLFLALENLNKPTLIGPPSGIQGVFYGPYWIWALSAGLLVSRDPRIVDLLVLTIPYFIVFPYILYKLKNIFGVYIMGSLWLLFIFSSVNYATFIWNPHYAPLLLLVLIYLLITNSYSISGMNLIRFSIAGFAAGLLFNFHISLGVGVIIGSLIFVLIYALLNILSAKKKSSRFKDFFEIGTSFSAGVILAFIPFIVFEMRHGFAQTSALFNEITGSTSSVLLSGLSNVEILQQFFGAFAKVLLVPTGIGYVILLLSTGMFLFLIFRKKIKLSDTEFRLSLILSSVSITILAVYLTAKNPVWEYHFIAIEVLWLMLVALFLKRLKYLQYLFFIWIGILCVFQFISFLKAFNADPYKESTLAAKEHVVETIHEDSGEKDFAVYAYNPAIYTYDYDYLFEWKGKKREKMPVTINDTSTVYLIIPETTDAIFEDFIRYRTEGYRTTRILRISDGTTILKREISNENL